MARDRVFNHRRVSVFRLGRHESLIRNFSYIARCRDVRRPMKVKAERTAPVLRRNQTQSDSGFATERR